MPKKGLSEQEEKIKEQIDVLMTESAKALDIIWEYAYQEGVKSMEPVIAELKEKNEKMKAKVEAILKAMEL